MLTGDRAESTIQDFIQGDRDPVRDHEIADLKAQLDNILEHVLSRLSLTNLSLNPPRLIALVEKRTYLLKYLSLQKIHTVHCNNSKTQSSKRRMSRSGLYHTTSNDTSGESSRVLDHCLERRIKAWERAQVIPKIGARQN